MDEKFKKRVNSYSSFSKSSNIEKEKVQRKVTMPTSSNLIEKYSIKDEVSEENENSSSSSSYSYPNGYTPANLKNKINQARTAINVATTLSKLHLLVPILLIIVFIFFVPLLILLIGTAVNVKVPFLNKSTETTSERTTSNKIYSIVDNVVNKYKKDYNVDVDRYLLLAVLLADKDPSFYSTNPSDSTENKQINEALNEKYANILASFQLERQSKCSLFSKTKRQIARNDEKNSTTIDNLEKNDKNFNCNLTTDIVKYNIDNKKGILNNDNSGSIFYWNMIDSIFLEEYYKDKFKDSINKEKTKDELLTHIYKYRDNLEIYDKDKNKENG